jgi:hypothetical protein
LWGPHPIGVRRLESLIAGLPLTGATARALSERAAVGWTTDTDLLALIAELLDYSNRQQYAMHVKNAKIPQPIHIPRPEDERIRRERQQASVEDMKSITKTFGIEVVKSVDTPNEEENS